MNFNFFWFFLTGLQMQPLSQRDAQVLHRPGQQVRHQPVAQPEVQLHLLARQQRFNAATCHPDYQVRLIGGFMMWNLIEFFKNYFYQQPLGGFM